MLTPQQRLENLIDSIKTADEWYDDEDHPIVFATEKQVKAINIALQKDRQGHQETQSDRLAGDAVWPQVVFLLVEQRHDAGRRKCPHRQYVW